MSIAEPLLQSLNALPEPAWSTILQALGQCGLGRVCRGGKGIF
ncbi:hypothetical protein [Pseudanabaena sp. FACHB-2040]|nr:hypothetical protein [Pseudanabaena sp. FACHB-2040]